MSSKPDDLEAVRSLIDTLQPFSNDDRERIIRFWPGGGTCLRIAELNYPKIGIIIQVASGPRNETSISLLSA
jgi:hypothetical protein